jgi:hypothetical protein
MPTIKKSGAIGGNKAIIIIKLGDKKRGGFQLYRAKDPSIQCLVLVNLSPLLVPSARTTSFKVLDRIGVAVCGPDRFTSVSEGV